MSHSSVLWVQFRRIPTRESPDFSRGECQVADHQAIVSPLLEFASRLEQVTCRAKTTYSGGSYHVARKFGCKYTNYQIAKGRC